MDKETEEKLHKFQLEMISMFRTTKAGEKILMEAKDEMVKELQKIHLPVTPTHMNALAHGFLWAMNFFRESNENAEKFKIVGMTMANAVSCVSFEVMEAFNIKKNYLEKDGIKIKEEDENLLKTNK